jgi:hypothetical protein
MNDLTQWRAVAPRVRGGDLVFFQGTGFLSDAIGFFTGSILTHSAMILDPAITKGEVDILESTIETINGREVNGPQINTLEYRLATYDAGGRVWIAFLSDKVRGLLDCEAMWTFASRKLGRDHYNKLELLEYVGQKIPLINDLPIYGPDSDSEVCSEFCCQLLQAGGFYGLDPFVTPPQKLAELKIYSGIEQVIGTPKRIKKFNTR